MSIDTQFHLLMTATAMRLGNIVFLPWWVVWGGGRSPKEGSSMRHFRRLYRPRGGLLP